MQGTLAREYVSAQGTLAREHIFSTQGTQFCRLLEITFLYFFPFLMITVRFRISLWENKWPFGHNFQNSGFRCKKRNDFLGTTVKIFNFPVKNE